MTLSEQVARHARTTPDAVALTHDDRHHTFRELHTRASRFANVLRDRGVDAGDRVAVLARNCPEMLEAYVACTRIGAIAVPINFRLTAAEIDYQLRHSGAVLLLTDELHAGTAQEAATGTAVREVLVTGEPLEAVMAAASEEYVAAAVDPAGPAFIMYTSGTTGRPKGATLSHANLYHQTVGRALSTGLPLDCRTWLVGTPLFHIGGLVSGLPALLLGGRIVLAPGGPFDPEQALALLERERVAYCFFVPSQWQEIVRSPGIAERDLSALRIAVWGAAPASPTLVREIQTALPGVLVGTGYGQTETTAATTLLVGQDAVRKPGSVGQPLLGMECRVVDDEMRDVATGEIGELVVRGPMVMLGYWDDAEATAETFQGGWLHSGDLVRQDDEGYLFIVDRKKDMIISGGENIYCAEVEDALASHPGVAEVAVVGVPHPTWGETPVAVVVARDGIEPTADEVEAWARQRLAGYKVPRELRFVDALPRNASGKVLKSVLREKSEPILEGTPQP